jgi:hypothetical protein
MLYYTQTWIGGGGGNDNERRVEKFVQSSNEAEAVDLLRTPGASSCTVTKGSHILWISINLCQLVYFFCPLCGSNKHKNKNKCQLV